jgi:hypothetical protein
LVKFFSIFDAQNSKSNIDYKLLLLEELTIRHQNSVSGKETKCDLKFSLIGNLAEVCIENDCVYGI